MNKPTTPFSQRELLPGRNVEIQKKKVNFYWFTQRDFLPRKKVCLTPDAVAAITANGIGSMKVMPVQMLTFQIKIIAKPERSY